MTLYAANILILIGLVIVAISLGLGLTSLVKGGKYSTNWANRFMRMRVAAQAVALIFVVLGLWLRGQG